MRRLLVALLLALSGVVLTQMPAHACTCVKNDTPAQIKNATTVLLGKVTSSARDGKTLTYDVQVERVYKGAAATGVTLESPSTKKACALDDLVADRRYVIFGTQQGDVVEVNSCGGTAPMTDKLLTAVTGALGAGTSPEPSPGSQPTKATFTRVDDTNPTKFPRLAAPGAALVIIGLLGLLFLRRVGRAH
jgi:hypothetical protein